MDFPNFPRLSKEKQEKIERELVESISDIPFENIKFEDRTDPVNPMPLFNNEFKKQLKKLCNIERIASLVNKRK